MGAHYLPRDPQASDSPAVIEIAVRLLENPDTHDPEVRFIPESPCAPADTTAWLTAIAAALYARPEAIQPGVMEHLSVLLRDPGTPMETLQTTGKVLRELAASRHAEAATTLATQILEEPHHSAKLYAAMTDVLHHAVTWSGCAVDTGAIERLAARPHLTGFRESLVTGILERHICGDGGSEKDRERMRRGEVPGSKYAAYYLSGGALSPEWSRHFPLHAEVANRLGHGPRQVLMVSNIGDGQGDEILRCAPLLQSLLDFNPGLHVTLATRRTYLFTHPRILTVSFAERDRLHRLLEGAWDAILHFYEANVHEANHDLAFSQAVNDLARRTPPFLFAAGGSDRTAWERVAKDGERLDEYLALNKERANNTYDMVFRLIAEIGLPLRWGESAPRSEWVLAGVPSAAAEAFWKELTRANQAQRPVALLVPFGGIEPLKGYVHAEGIAGEVRELVRAGFYVVLLPSGSEWGSAARTEEAFALLDHADREHTVVAPDPGASEPAAGGLSHADHVMGLFLHCIRFADLAVCVEGWMMHAAHCLGKPYRVLMLAYSHTEHWFPYCRSPRQRLQAAIRQAPQLGTRPCIVEQPRKFALLLALRLIGDARSERALPLLRWAVASPDRHVRLAASEALCKSPVQDAEIAALLRDPSHEVRAVAATALLERLPEPPRPDLLAHRWLAMVPRDWPSICRLGEAARPMFEAAASGDDHVIRREASRFVSALDFAAGRLADKSEPPPKQGFLSRLFGRNEP